MIDDRCKSFRRRAQMMSIFPDWRMRGIRLTENAGKRGTVGRD